MRYKLDNVVQQKRLPQPSRYRQREERKRKEEDLEKSRSMAKFGLSDRFRLNGKPGCLLVRYRHVRADMTFSAGPEACHLRNYLSDN